MPAQRCPWVDLTKPDYIAYHDLEWGVPVRDDRKMFEFLVLESAQAGLSWYTILSKRGNYRNAYHGFDAERVARFNSRSVDRLLRNSGIVRNRLKIEASIGNARCFVKVAEQYGSFSTYLWRFFDDRPLINAPRELSDYRASSELSDAISADMRKRGFRFFGTTICYAHLQATGLINDHVLSCYRRQELIDSY